MTSHSESAEPVPASSSFPASFQGYRERVMQAIERYLPGCSTTPNRLHEAMRYSALAGGKCVRAMLVYASGEAVDVPLARLDALASAVEMIHAYSLIHDDLPAMDDSAMRRGAPSCHQAYDEALAILAGDALQALAFEIITGDAELATMPGQCVKMLHTLAHASGSLGMAGGQVMDLDAQGETLDVPSLEDMHRRKTGALIQASVELGTLCNPGSGNGEYRALSAYGRHIGLAFQIKDDLLDAEADAQTLGKPQGSDIALNKATYPQVLGVQGAETVMQEAHEQALEALAEFDARADGLRELAGFVIHRTN